MTAKSEESTRTFAATLVQAFLAGHPEDAAPVLEDLEPEEAVAILLQQSDQVAARLLEHTNADDAARIVLADDLSKTQRFFSELEPLYAAGLLARFSPARRDELLRMVTPAVARDLSEILHAAPGTAGRIMDRRITFFREDQTVSEAIERIRKIRDRRILDLMVVDDDDRLVAVLPLHTVATAEPKTRLGELSAAPPVAVHPHIREEEVVELLEAHRLPTLAVVDLDGRLVGVIRYDELLQAVQDDAASAAQAMVGASREERALSTPWVAIRSRLPWLNINLATAFLASAVVGVFDETIARITALAVLMPVVAGQSGNTGAQALAITQRGLALGEIRTAHVWRLMGKELLVGAGAGVAIAIVTALGVLLWSGKPLLAVVISVSMVFSMSMAALSGAAIPIILTALGRDPATASSIVLTTITDIVGFSSFLGLATLLAGSLQ